MSHALGSKPVVQWLNLFTVRQVLGMIPCVAITGSCEPGKPAVRELRVATKSMGSCVTSAALSPVKDKYIMQSHLGIIFFRVSLKTCLHFV